MKNNRLVIEAGTVFGNLTYLKDAPNRITPSGQPHRMALCKCVCGKEKSVLVSHLTRGKAGHCGCLLSGNNEGAGTKLHNSWRGMINRCSETYFQKQYYFDKGITFFIGWSSFKVFKRWALNNGYVEGYQIDRIDNSKGYFPSNCRFVTQEENISNRDITIKVVFKGELISLYDICRRLKYTERRIATIYNRINRGWDGELAVLTPIRTGNYKVKLVETKLK